MSNHPCFFGSLRKGTPSRWVLGFLIFGWIALAGCSDPKSNQKTCDPALCEPLNDGCLSTTCDETSDSQTCVPNTPAPDGQACTITSTQTAGVCAAGQCVENQVQEDCEIDADCDHLDSQTCDAPTCQGVRVVHACSETKHCVPTHVDDDTLCAGEVAIEPCPNGFAPVVCTDATEQSVPACATTCEPHQSGAPCASDLRCDATGTACVAWPELGWNALGHPPASGLTGVVNAINLRLGELRDHGVDTTQLWLRPRGGSESQVHLNVWLGNPQMLEAWKTLQDEYGFKIVWTINCDVVDNDEDAIVADEMTLYQNALTLGLQIHLNEAGNEQYLESKFPGMTVERYLQVAQRYDNELAFTNLPLLIQIAPQGKFGITTDDSPEWMLTIEAHYVDWNEKVYQVVAAQPNHDFLPVIHVYARQNYFRWELIAEARDAFGKDKIVCTEYGSRDDVEDGTANPQLERELAAIMVTLFRAPDLLMAHTFWNNYTDEAVASHAWYHNEEITPKGQELLDFFFDYP